MKSKICVFCRKRFLPSAPQSKYCSKKCRNKAAYHKRMARKELAAGGMIPVRDLWVETVDASEELIGYRIVKLLSIGEKSAHVDYHGAASLVDISKIRGWVENGHVNREDVSKFLEGLR